MTPLLFITQVFGFLLQTLPVSVLCFAPLADDSLQFSRRRVAAGFCGGLVLAAIFFAVLVSFFFDPSASVNTPLVLAQNGYMSVIFLACVLVYMRIVRVATVQKLLILLIVVHYMVVLFTIGGMMLGLWTLQEEFVVFLPYNARGLIVYALLFALTLPPVMVFLRRTVRASLRQLTDDVLRRGCVYFAAALGLYCLCVAAVTNVSAISNHDILPVALFLAVVICTDAIVYALFFGEVRLAARNQALQGQLASFDEQYRQISSAAEEYRRVRHDLRHHFGVISVYNQEGQRDKLAAYLKRYADSVDDIDTQPLSGYLALDAVLRYYLARARDADIQTTLDLCRLPAHLDFSVTDITVLFGNLLENAIHACQLLPQDARTLRLSVRQNGVSLLIFIENSCAEDGCEQPQYGNETLFLQRRQRGQGLRCIRMAVEKYHGRVEYKKAGGRFSVRVVLNIP